MCVLSLRHLPVAEEQEETGWKYIHGDVFRPPPHLNLFAACVGTGTQILTMAIIVFALALIGVFYPYNRGALLTTFVVSCSLLGPPAHHPQLGQFGNAERD